jgi:hypothetical protein
MNYYPSGKRFLLRFKKKGGEEKELPVHHKLEEFFDQHLKATGLEKEPESPLFPADFGKTGKLSRRPLVRTDAADMLKRRLKAQNNTQSIFTDLDTISRFQTELIAEHIVARVQTAGNVVEGLTEGATAPPRDPRCSQPWREITGADNSALNDIVR